MDGEGYLGTQNNQNNDTDDNFYAYNDDEFDMTVKYRTDRRAGAREMAKRLENLSHGETSMEKARLHYNFKDIASAMYFLWDEVTTSRELHEVLTNRDVTGIDFRLTLLTNNIMMDIAKHLSNRKEILDRNNLSQTLKTSAKAKNKTLKRDKGLSSSNKTNKPVSPRNFFNKSKGILGSARTLRMKVAKSKRSNGSIGSAGSIGSNRILTVSSKTVSPSTIDKKVSDIKALSFHGQRLTSEQLGYLVGPILSLKTIRYLELQENFLDSNSIEHLIAILKDTDIEDLTLSSNSLFGDGIEYKAFFEAVGDSTLVGLDLSDNGLSSENVELLITSMANESPLKFLNLSGNSIGNLGAIHLAGFLRTSVAQLHSLSIASCHIHDKGGVSLATALPYNEYLEGLYLKDNYLSNEAAEAFIKAIATPQTKRELETSFRYSRNVFASADSLDSAADSRVNGKLKFLDLSENEQIDEETMNRLKVKTLQDSRKVFTSKCEWTKEAWRLAESNKGAEAIAKAIKGLRGKSRQLFIDFIANQKNKKTLFEVLMFCSLGHQGRKARSKRRAGKIGGNSTNLFDISTNTARPKSLSSNFNKRQQTSSANFRRDTEGYYEAMKSIVEIGKFDLYRKTSDGKRVFLYVLRIHKNTKILNWAIKYGTFVGKYDIEKGPAVHSSKDCVVRFATKVTADKLVAIKFFKSVEIFDREIAARKQILGSILKESPFASVEFGDSRTTRGYKSTALTPLDHDDASNYIVRVTDFGERRLKNVAKSKVVGGRKSRPFKRDRRTGSKPGVKLPREKVEHYIVMPRMGRSLFDVIHTEKLAGYDIIEIKRIMQIAANALNFVHSKDFIHADFKPRNFLRGLEGELTKPSWKLVDFDASVKIDHLTSSKVSTAYCPPEKARHVFLDEQCYASKSYDVWSFGVVLYELLTGTPFFNSDRLDDNLFSTDAKVELMNWLGLDEVRIGRIVANRRRLRITEAVEISAIDLLKKCLKREEGRNNCRISFDEILRHPFFKSNDENENVVRGMIEEPNWKHFFLSHVQVEAAGTVKDIFYSIRSWGCVCWLDMEASDLTVKGMFEGVKYATHFVQILTKSILEKAYCVLELLWAIDLDKKILFVVEEDPRPGFKAFDYDNFIKFWTDDDKLELKKLVDTILSITTNLRFEGVLQKELEKITHDPDSNFHADDLVHLLSDVVFKRLDAQISDKSELVPYRRRNFETKAMMEEIMSKMDLVTPSMVRSQESKSSEEPKGLSNNIFKELELVVFIGERSDHNLAMLEEMKSGLKEYLHLADYENQWITIDGDTDYTPKQHERRIQDMHGGIQPITVFLVLLTPKFFLEKHGENFSEWDDRWNRRKVPLVAIQEDWFSQSYDDQDLERAKSSRGNFESIFLDTEIMTYRAKQPRLYEHKAMLEETARRIKKCTEYSIT